jgi:hypothetical protein
MKEGATARIYQSRVVRIGAAVVVPAVLNTVGRDRVPSRPKQREQTMSTPRCRLVPVVMWWRDLLSSTVANATLRNRHQRNVKPARYRNAVEVGARESSDPYHPTRPRSANLRHSRGPRPTSRHWSRPHHPNRPGRDFTYTLAKLAKHQASWLKVADRLLDRSTEKARRLPSTIAASCAAELEQLQRT